MTATPRLPQPPDGDELADGVGAELVVELADGSAFAVDGLTVEGAVEDGAGAAEDGAAVGATGVELESRGTGESLGSALEEALGVAVLFAEWVDSAGAGLAGAGSFGWATRVMVVPRSPESA